MGSNFSPFGSRCSPVCLPAVPAYLPAVPTNPSVFLESLYSQSGSLYSQSRSLYSQSGSLLSPVHSLPTSTQTPLPLNYSFFVLNTQKTQKTKHVLQVGRSLLKKVLLAFTSKLFDL